MKNIIRVKDGENLHVVVELAPSVSDPGGEIPAISQLYRVVAHSWGPMLELVPLAKEPYSFSLETLRALGN